MVFTTTNNAFHFYHRFCLTIKKRRTICLQKSVQNNNKSTATSLTRICSQRICVSVVYSVYTKPMVSSTQSVSRVFMQFSNVFNRLLFYVNFKNSSLRWNRTSLLEIITYCSNSVTIIITSWC